MSSPPAPEAPPLAKTARRVELGIVIPTRNEAQNIGPLLDRLAAALDGIAWEAVFVDDHSPDGTAGLVRDIARGDHRVRLIERVGRRGLSSAVVEGMLASSAPVLAVIDGDLQHDEAILKDLFHAVADRGYDMAVGTRYAPGGSTGEWSEDRKRISAVATKMATALLKTRLADPMSGFFVLKREVFDAAMPRLSNIGFKILLDIIASSPKSLKIEEIPFTFRPRQAGASKLDAKVSQEFVVLLLEKTVGRFLPIRFLMFGAVGAMGLVVHLGLLGLLVRVLNAPFQTAQIVAVICAMTFNFVVNNSLTYRDVSLKGLGFLRGLITFYLTCSIGAVGNVGVAQMIYNTNNRWWLAGLAGAAVGVVWNYATSSLFTWKAR